jgi:hypothetical protein
MIWYRKVGWLADYRWVAPSRCLDSLSRCRVTHCRETVLDPAAACLHDWGCRRRGRPRNTQARQEWQSRLRTGVDLCIRTSSQVPETSTILHNASVRLTVSWVPDAGVGRLAIGKPPLAARLPAGHAAWTAAGSCGERGRRLRPHTITRQHDPPTKTRPDFAQSVSPLSS